MAELVTPLISVIIPVYNSSTYLERCVHSILSQTYTNFELLLVDDGSTDSSSELCDSFLLLDERVRVFHKSNGGPSSARNIGINNARGEWIAFCDSDDWVLPFWLDYYAHNFSDCDLVCQGIIFDYSMVDTQRGCQNLEVVYKGQANALLDKMFTTETIGYVFSKCFKRSIILDFNIKFDERFSFREDEEFVLRYLTRCNTVVSVATTSYHYIVPDFAKKYGVDKNGYELSMSLFKSAIQISHGKESDYSIKLKKDITGYLMRDFLSLQTFYKRREQLLEYRSCLGTYLRSLHIFPLTKYLIYGDFTGILSTILLTLHLSIKRIVTD